MNYTNKNYKFKYPKNLRKYKHKAQLKRQSNNFQKAYYFFNHLKKSDSCPQLWNNQWNNLHLQYKSLVNYRLIQRFFKNYDSYLNKFYIFYNHNNLQILAHSLRIFRAHKTRKKIKKYVKILSAKKPYSNLAKLLIQVNKVTYVKLSFYHISLPKQLIQKNAIKVFKKQKKERFFWESLQLIYGVFKGYVSASILVNLIIAHTRRNPRRLAFVSYLKRLCDWHFKNIKKSQIQGVRIEVKGRFNAKSRAKKYIISTGRVRIHEISSNVIYARNDAFTKFGCLGIKVWLCPK